MKLLLTLFAIAFFPVLGIAQDNPLVWPQFRGPGNSGVADDQKPPVEFGPDKNVKWKVPVPSGVSSPIIVGDKLVITAFDQDKLFTIAYNQTDGKEAWRAQAPAQKIERFLKNEGSPAASTPVTDGQRIISYFGSCGLFCYDASGKQLWKFEMPTVAMPGEFGSGVSPILADGLVILVRDETKNAKIIAVDVATGSLRWETKRQSPASYATPVVWDTPTGKQIVAAGHARMIGYDLKTGQEKWSFFGIPSGCCASPVIADGVLFFAGYSPGGADDKENQMPTFDGMLKNLDKDKDGALSKEEAEKAFGGFFDTQDTNKDGKVTRDEWDAIIKFMQEGKNSAFALKPGVSGDITTSHLLWQKTKGMPYIASAIVYRGQYVMIKDGGIVTAYDVKSGDELYMERVAATGNYYASPVAANGHLYFTALNDGAITVLKAGQPKPQVVAKNPKLGERTSASPAIANNTIYIRTETHLYAFAEKK